MKKLSYIFFIFILVAGCGSKYNITTGNETEGIPRTTFSFDRKDYPREDDIFQEYHIAPGDLLDVLYQVNFMQVGIDFIIDIDHTISIKFLYAPELNTEQNVKPDGTISLPYIGEIYVAYKTPAQLKEELEELYRGVLRDPEIYVAVPEFSSKIKALKNDLHTAPRGLSRLVTVRPDGFATFPLLGDIFVAGRSVPEMDKLLDSKYKDIMPGLSVDLFLEKTVGSVVYVAGQVQKPGSYQIIKPISILQAIVLAGGQTDNARLDSVIVFRRHKKEFIATRLNISNLVHLGHGAKFFYLRPDDIVFIPKTRIATLGQLMRQLSDVFLFNGWSLSGQIFGDYIFRLQGSSD